MNRNLIIRRKLDILALVVGVGISAPGCTEEEINAVLAGVEVAAHELNDEDVSFRDWLSSELDD